MKTTIVKTRWRWGRLTVILLILCLSSLAVGAVAALAAVGLNLDPGTGFAFGCMCGAPTGVVVTTIMAYTWPPWEFIHEEVEVPNERTP